MKFGYHNHDFEFSESLNNQKLFDIMMNSMDPDMVVVQLDIGNLYNGGAIALDVVKQYRADLRTSMLRMKLSVQEGLKI